MTDREFAQLAESIKRMEAKFEEFTTRLLAAQERMIRAIEQMEKAQPVVNQVYHVGADSARTGDVAEMVKRNIQRALVRQGSSIDAVGGAGCKASTERLRP